MSLLIGSADNSLFKSLNPTTQKRTISLMSYRFLSQTAQVQCDVGQNPKPNSVIFDESKLNHYFISGFVDAEGSFYLGMSKDSKRSSGWSLIPGFAIKLHSKDLSLLTQIQSFFGVGAITLDNKRNIAQYRVSSISDLINNIFPHFDKYPLLTQKRGDYILFKSIIDLMRKKEHLTYEGLCKIVAIKSSMNKGLNDGLNLAFPGIPSVERPVFQLPESLDPHWLAGFASGEGCFRVTIYNSPKSKQGKSVQLKFQITQHEKDSALLALIIKYLNCGSLQTSRNAKDLQVTSFKEVYGIIIPFFTKHPILGVKALDLADLVMVAELMKEKAHLTKDGLEQIIIIGSGMNTGRYSDSS